VDILAPAVTGTQNVLEGSHAANVRRVVVVSSVAAVLANPSVPDGAIVDEDCWSDEDYCRATKVQHVLASCITYKYMALYTTYNL
jgi:nucleoside-diphosphate-sugar epimerase